MIYALTSFGELQPKMRLNTGVGEILKDSGHIGHGATGYCCRPLFIENSHFGLFRTYITRRPRKMRVREVAIAMVVCLFSVLALAQRETGTISGTVTDSTGAVVSTGKITVKSTTTGTVRVASTNPSGLYSVPDLQPGVYEVTVEAAGFSVYKGKVEVTIG